MSEKIPTHKKIKKANTIKAQIIRQLKERGDYKSTLDFMIDITAGNLYAYFLILRDVEALSCASITEISREGNEKKRADPLLGALREQTEQVRKNLRELKLTLLSVEALGDDDMDELIKQVNSVDKEE